MRRWKINFRQILIGAVIVVIVLMMADFNNRMNELHRLTAQKEHSAAQITDLVETQLALETQIAYATSVPAVERWAYEDGRMARQGDQVIVPVPAGGEVPAPTPTPMAPAEVVNNWDVWLALFFGSEP